MPPTNRFTPYPVNKPDHPHCLQARLLVFASHFNDILDHEKCPREKYVTRDKSSMTSVLHRGQRKLLMSEIGALVLLDPSVQYTTVYAGAAPGIHIPLLSDSSPISHSICTIPRLSRSRRQIK